MLGAACNGAAPGDSKATQRESTTAPASERLVPLRTANPLPPDSVVRAVPDSAVFGLVSSSGPARNVLLITLCSWRADHVGAYGYARDTTPHLDAFARDAMIFDQAYANGTFTDVSHASLFTGLLPGHDGMMDVGDRVRDDVHTLPEVLGAYGFRSLVLLDHAGGMTPPVIQTMARGFGSVTSAPSGALAPALARWIADSPAPWLAWVHVRRAHIPYGTGEPFAHAIDPAVKIWLDKRAKPPLSTGSADPDAALLTAISADPRVRQSLDDVYDSGLARADAQLGQILNAASAAGWMENTLIVIVADHGEALGESGQFGHQGKLISSVLHVPLVIRLPGGKRGRNASPVSLVDVMPTIEATMGAKAQVTADGVSLLPALRGQPIPTRAILAQTVAPAGAEGKMTLEEVLIAPPYWLRVNTFDSRLWRSSPSGWQDVSTSDPDTMRALEASRALLSAGSTFHESRRPVPPAQEEELRKQGYW